MGLCWNFLFGRDEWIYMYIIIMPKQLSTFKRENGHQCTKLVTEAPFTHSRIASRIILDLNPWSSGVQRQDFVAVPVWVRCELGTYTDQYGVYTDRQGSNTDVAGKAPEWTRTIHGWARQQLGIYTVCLRTCTFFTGIPTECWRCVDKRWHKLIIGHLLC